MQRLLSRISAIVGDSGVLSAAEVRGRASSWLNSEPSRAIGLVRPRSTDELSRVMALCHHSGQRVVVQGGMTGLVDGGTAVPGELALSLERMKRIEEVSTTDRSLTAEAGATIQSVQEAARAHELMLGVDWGARGTATVGGGIATNAGGTGVLRFGTMREQVLGLEAVLADGTVISSMNHMLKNNTGYDLKHLFIGTEGTLGIITRAVLRLRPQPQSENTALVGVDSFTKVCALLGHLDRRLAGTLSAFEVMWRGHYQLVVEAGKHPSILSLDHPYYILVEARGSDRNGDRERFEAALSEASSLISDAALCESAKQRDALWAIRDDIPALAEALRPMITFDVSLRLTDIEPYVGKVEAALNKRFPAGRGTIFGHLGDGNLHICWCTGTASAHGLDEMSSIVYGNLRDFGGSISAEHGIGVQKIRYLPYSRNPTEIQWMKSLKRLFDPKSILNAGRIVPEPQQPLQQ